MHFWRGASETPGTVAFIQNVGWASTEALLSVLRYYQSFSKPLIGQEVVGVSFSTGLADPFRNRYSYTPNLVIVEYTPFFGNTVNSF